MGKNLSRLYSAELEGVNAKIIEVEADINIGLHQFNIVGLADRSLSEAKERVNSALKNSGVKPPNRENRKITINLAPADFKKTGSHYDLAIALSYLVASNQIKNFKTEDKIFLGELALDGRLRSITGALNIAQHASEHGFKFLFLPQENANEAAAIKSLNIIPVKNLLDLIKIFETNIPFETHTLVEDDRKKIFYLDYSEIHGQEKVKRAIMIAAAGNHNLLMSGAPGVGKSVLAQAAAGILPSLSYEESIEVTKIWSAAGFRPQGLITERPFRNPHHSSSSVALIGGGHDPRPGEISLAHRGILFLDELPEFRRVTLESLREPMESGEIRIARAKGSVVFPAKFMLICAMNPCPCGFFGDTSQECKCSPYEIGQYQQKISGPFLDRIDIHIQVGKFNVSKFIQEASTLPKKENAAIQNRIIAARQIQEQRGSLLHESQRYPLTNAELTSQNLEKVINLDHEGIAFLKTIESLGISPRGYYRVLKVARTIADLEKNERVSKSHLAEALGYKIKGFSTS